MELTEISISKIIPSPFQPRESFDKKTIKQLAESVKDIGLINPITVRPTDDGNYQIVSGERRWRAFQFAKKKVIHAIIKDLTDKQYKIESLAENIHREDLTMIEKGNAAKIIFEEHEIDTPAKELASKLSTIGAKISKKKKLATPDVFILNVCKKIGRGTSAISGWLKLISVDPEIQMLELAKPKDERMDSKILAKLTTIDDSELQKKVYAKIVKDESSRLKARDMIANIQKLPEKQQKLVLESDLLIDIVKTPTGEYTIEISEEEIIRMRIAVQQGIEDTAKALAQPIVRERGRHRRNWESHLSVLTILDKLFCPYCGQPASEHLRWVNHPKMNLDDAAKQAGDNFTEATTRKNPDPRFWSENEDDN